MKRILVFSIVSLFVLQAVAIAQSEGGIDIFGYYQGQFMQTKMSGSSAVDYTNFGLQQMNILFSKNLVHQFAVRRQLCVRQELGLIQH